jgi:hypothetical protein
MKTLTVLFVVLAASVSAHAPAAFTLDDMRDAFECGVLKGTILASRGQAKDLQKEYDERACGAVEMFLANHPK